MTKICSLDDCDHPRHLTATGRADPIMCAAHGRMLHILQAELNARTGNSVGATDLLHRVKRARLWA
jgi:hypothetical protein